MVKVPPVEESRSDDADPMLSCALSSRRQPEEGMQQAFEPHAGAQYTHFR